VRQGWGDQPTIAQRNPLVAIEYNQFMGSVDQDNQLRAEHACTLRSRRNWLPLLFWLLDISTGTDDAWLLARQFGTASLNQNHHNWLLRLSWELVTARQEQMRAVAAEQAPTPVPAAPSPLLRAPSPPTARVLNTIIKVNKIYQAAVLMFHGGLDCPSLVY
jgi:hypothetical protein